MQADKKSAVVGLLENNLKMPLAEGMEVKKTNKKISISPSNKLLGQIVNFIGEVIVPINKNKSSLNKKKSSGVKQTKKDENISIDQTEVKMLNRSKVNTPLLSGLIGLDTFLPFGKGQRSMLVGDKKTGKTSIALSYVKANKHNDVVFIYNGIGKTKSDIYDIAEMLTEEGVYDKSIIVSSFISDTETAQYYSPYLATTIGEYFKNKMKKDVFIIYDDLTKHADAYRSLSIQMNITPGRESFPGDIFYAHSRLLERSGKFKDGTSISSISICETLEEDIYSYLPTNIISITDGQVVTDVKKSNLNIYPAINYGASVSRVGRAAQLEILKNAQIDLPFLLANYETTSETFNFNEGDGKNGQSSAYKGFILSTFLDQQNGLYSPKIMWVLISLLKTDSFKMIYKKEHAYEIINIIVSKLNNEEKFINALNGIDENSEAGWDGFIKFLTIELKPIISQFLRKSYEYNPILLNQVFNNYIGFNFLDLGEEKTDENKKAVNDGN